MQSGRESLISFHAKSGNPKLQHAKSRSGTLNPRDCPPLSSAARRRTITGNWQSGSRTTPVQLIALDSNVAKGGFERVAHGTPMSNADKSSSNPGTCRGVSKLRAFSAALAFALCVCPSPGQAPKVERLPGIPALKKQLRAAKAKLEKVRNSDSKNEPRSTADAEFGGLFDKSYAALEQEGRELLQLRKDDAYQKRMDDFVEANALCVYLEPGQVTAEIGFGFQRKARGWRRSAFDQAGLPAGPPRKP